MDDSRIQSTNRLASTTGREPVARCYGPATPLLIGLLWAAVTMLGAWSGEWVAAILLACIMATLAVAFVAFAVALTHLLKDLCDTFE